MTQGELMRQLEGLGLSGGHVLVHSSLASLGRLDGGARALCEVLIRLVGEAGTIVMPAFTYRETSQGMRTAGPTVTRTAFQPDLAVSREIGVVAEEFRRIPGVLRSSHPTHSFAAWGRQARDVLSTQRDNNPLGPLKKLNVLQGQLLLVGTSMQAASPAFLALERHASIYLRRDTAVRLNAAGYYERVVLENIPGCTAAFACLEQQLDPAKLRTVALPRGWARKMPVRYVVSLAARLLDANPRALLCAAPDCPRCSADRAPGPARAANGAL